MKQGWERTTLMEVCEQITDGSHFSPESSGDAEYPYITVRDIDNDIIDFDNCKFINKINYQSLLKNGCKPNSGDLLFSKDGTVGKVSLVDFERDFVVLSSLAIIRPKRKIIESSLLKYILKDPSFLETAIGMKTGVAIRRIILKNLKQIEICFPKSLPEQQRIVAILDEAFAVIAKAKTNAEQNLKNAKELFESYLQGVFENKGEGWEEKLLGELTNVQRGSSPRPKGDPKYFSETETVFNWITISDISSYCDNNVLLQTREWLTEAGSKQSRFVDENEFIIAVSGSTTGKCCITGIKGFIYDGLAVVKIKNNRIEPKFLLIYMMSLYKTINNSKAGAAFPNINTNYLNNLPISLPPLKAQQTIIQKLDALSAQTKKLEAIYQQKINDLEELKKSVLQKAFSGELNTEYIKK